MSYLLKKENQRKIHFHISLNLLGQFKPNIARIVLRWHLWNYIWQTHSPFKMAAVTIKYGSNNQSKIFYPCMISLMLVLYKCMTMGCMQGLLKKLYKVEQDCFGAPGTGWDVSQNKMFMVKTMGPLRDSRAPSWLPVPRTDVPAEPPTYRPSLYVV